MGFNSGFKGLKVTVVSAVPTASEDIPPLLRRCSNGSGTVSVRGALAGTLEVSCFYQLLQMRGGTVYLLANQLP